MAESKRKYVIPADGVDRAGMRTSEESAELLRGHGPHSSQDEKHDVAKNESHLQNCIGVEQTHIHQGKSDSEPCLIQPNCASDFFFHLAHVSVCADLQVFMFETVLKVIEAFFVPGVVEHITYLNEICFFLSI